MSESTRLRRSKSNGPEQLLDAFRRAVVAIESDEPRVAAQLLDGILRVMPTNPDARCLRGIAAIRLGDFTAAVKHLRIGTRGLGPISSENRDSYNEYALALRSDGQYDESERVLRQLVELEPEFGAAWHNLALVLQHNDMIDEAVAAARRALAARPDDAGAMLLLGKMLRSKGRLLTARGVLEAAATRAPDDVSIATTLGNTYFYLGQIDEALGCFRRAVELHPDEAVFHSNYATMLTHCRRYEDARVEHAAAYALAPTDPDIVVRRAAFLLNTAPLAEGWRAYNARLDSSPGSLRWTGSPQWDGSDISGQTLCVYREQGLGDEIMFASVYEELADRCARLIVECDPRLFDLYTRSFPNAEVRVVAEDGMAPKSNARPPRHPEADFVVPAGSTMEFLRDSVDKFSTQTSYLRADPVKVEAWGQRLRAAGNGPYVGISWRSMIRTAERRLEYTRLDEWGPILCQADLGITFVLLQYDQCEREVADAERRFGITITRWHDLDLMNDLDNVAALTANLDAVVAPRNAVAMLSGALGVETLALGNVGDWAECGTTQLPWFRTLECINRDIAGDWAPVIAEAATRINSLRAGQSVLQHSQRKAPV